MSETRELRALAAGAILLAAVLGGCGARPSPGREPLAELSGGGQRLELAPDGFVDLVLQLTPLRAVEEGTELVLFEHLVDARGRVVRTFDQPLAESWPLGRSFPVTSRLFLSALAPPPAPGEYALTVGLFDPLLGRFALKTAAPPVGRREHEVARVRILEAPGRPTRLDFLAGWDQAEEVSDRKLLRRRPLLPDRVGELRLAPVDRPLEVWLEVDLPVAGLADELRIRDGAEHARLAISSPCARSDAEVIGVGTHALSLRLEPGAMGSCAIRFAANYVVRQGSAGRLVAPSLQAIAWRAAPEP